MSRNWALRKRAQYKAVYESGMMRGDRLVIIKALANGLEFSRYGFSVNKSLGKAVARNRVRRILKEIVRTTRIKPGWDIVFIARSKAAGSDYHQLKKSVEKSLNQVGLLVDKNEMVSTGVN